MTKARTLADNFAADINGITAGTGLSGGGTSGTVTLDVDTAVIQARVANVTDTEIGYLDGVTSALQTQLDAKIAKTLTTTTGDIIYASAANTPARLGIGSTDQILKVTDGVPVWATPSGGGKTWQQSATGSMTGASITVSSLTGQDIFVAWKDWSATDSANLSYRYNSNSSSIYRVQSSDAAGAQAKAWGDIGAADTSWSFLYIPAASSTIQVKTGISNLYPWSIKEPSAVTSIQFFPSAGTFDAGDYYVWELK
jgi:hypothetical protein